MRENPYQSVDTSEERGYDYHPVPEQYQEPMEQEKYYAPSKTYNMKEAD